MNKEKGIEILDQYINMMKNFSAEEASEFAREAKLLEEKFSNNVYEDIELSFPNVATTNVIISYTFTANVISGWSIPNNNFLPKEYLAA
jgi:hypothetical protein